MPLPVRPFRPRTPHLHRNGTARSDRPAGRQSTEGARTSLCTMPKSRACRGFLPTSRTSSDPAKRGCLACGLNLFRSNPRRPALPAHRARLGRSRPCPARTKVRSMAEILQRNCCERRRQARGQSIAIARSPGLLLLRRRFSQRSRTAGFGTRGELPISTGFLRRPQWQTARRSGRDIRRMSETVRPAGHH